MNKTITLWAVLYGILLAAFPLSAQTDGEFSLQGIAVQVNMGTSSGSGGGYTLTQTVRPLDGTSSLGGSYALRGRFMPFDSFLQGIACLVDIEDLTLFVSQWLDSGDIEANFDWDGDPQNLVDLYDYSFFAAIWMGNCPENWPWP